MARCLSNDSCDFEPMMQKAPLRRRSIHDHPPSHGTDTPAALHALHMRQFGSFQKARLVICIVLSNTISQVARVYIPLPVSW